MRIRLPSTEAVGQAIDLRDTDVNGRRVRRAIRDPANESVSAPPPTPVHQHLDVVQSGMEFDLRTALAEAGRSIGLESPQREVIARLNRQIEAIDPGMPDLTAARRRVATAGADCDALEEQVAKTSGQLKAREEADLPTDGIEERLADLTRQLTEAETEAIAAREALASAEERAEAARDARAKRLSLVDRRENRRRAARSWLLDEVGDRFERALRALPTDAGSASPRSFDGANRDAALAVARIGALEAPIVLVDSPFESAVQARANLDAPVVLTSV